jgi:hypothetical protein
VTEIRNGTRFLWQSGIVFCLLLVSVVYVTRITRLGNGGVLVDVADAHPGSLAPQTRAFISDSAPARLYFTFFVSSKSAMPSHLKGVEDHVCRLLKALQAEAPERIDFRILDPQISDADGISYAARKKISPVSVRGVKQDEHGESRVWSSLAISYEGRPDVYIQDIRTRDLPRLEGWIRTRLAHIDKPLQPMFAFSAPEGFDEFPRYLSQHGPVVEVDLSHSAHLPSDADILFWIEPEHVTESHIRNLKRFVASGRTVVLAGSAYGVEYLAPEADQVVSYRIQKRSSAWEQLLRPFGLKPIPDLLMDRNAGAATVMMTDGSRRPVEAAFHLRNLPAFRDFRRLNTPARGGLCFAAASPLQVDPVRVAQAGFQAQIAATTTEHAWVVPLPLGRFVETDLDASLTVPKQNLMVLLSPRDPWSGQLLVLASATPFQNGSMSQAGYGHSVFIKDLVRSFASPDRLVRLRAAVRSPDLLQPTSLGQRLLWRGLVVGAVPCLFLIIGVWRYRRGENRRRLLLLDARWPSLLKYTVVALGAWVLLPMGLLSHWDRFGLDLTNHSLNTPATNLRELIEQERENIEVEFILSRGSQLPPVLRMVERRVRSMLATLDLAVTTIHPEEGSAAQLRQLVDSGMQPFEVERVLRDTVISSKVWSGLRLRRDGRASVIRRLDERTMEHFDFLLTAAIRRLDVEDNGADVAVFSDLPRLSPAEALEDYQKKGLSAPRGVDVYGRLKILLGDYGYRVHHVSSRDPELPANVEAILWLQPRRDSGQVILLLSDYLAHGGSAIVAMQHFNIQQRQYRGGGFETVYWPQPQFQDFDRYLRLIGVEQVREVLMDRTRHHLSLDTQVNRTAVREYNPQEVALPFLIRSVRPFYSPASPITRDLGDLLFVWGNRFELRQEELGQGGFETHVLVTTSDQAWSYPWRGGWLPEAVFNPAELLPGRQPLVVQLKGVFPRVEFVEDDEGRARLAPTRAPNTTPQSPATGSLLLVGSSEMLKNEHLFAEGFQHDQFLLNALAMIVHGVDMADLQSRHRQPPGFPYHTPATKLWWRLIVVAGGPLALVGLILLIRRRWRASR